jgi:hypothetical protein
MEKHYDAYNLIDLLYNKLQDFVERYSFTLIQSKGISWCNQLLDEVDVRWYNKEPDGDNQCEIANDGKKWDAETTIKELKVRLKNSFNYDTDGCHFFSIDGHYKDDNSEFSGYIVKEFDDTEPEFDDDIFYYGLSENNIIEAINNPENILDFVIISYKDITPEFAD